jgi:hypothetical protein
LEPGDGGFAWCRKSSTGEGELPHLIRLRQG